MTQTLELGGKTFTLSVPTPRQVAAIEALISSSLSEMQPTYQNLLRMLSVLAAGQHGVKSTKELWDLDPSHEDFGRIDAALGPLLQKVFDDRFDALEEAARTTAGNGP